MLLAGSRWSIGFAASATASWESLDHDPEVEVQVRAWLFSLTEGPPDDAGLVFGNPRHPYYDPEYWSARLNTDEGLVEMRFTVMAHREGADRVFIQYLGTPPPIDGRHPRR